MDAGFSPILRFVTGLFQLYTVSQDGTLVVWQSDTELDGLVLSKGRKKPKGDEEEEEEEEAGGEKRMEGEQGEVIRGRAEDPGERRAKNVRFKHMSK